MTDADALARYNNKYGDPRCEAIPREGPQGSNADRWRCWYRAGHEGRHMAMRAVGLLYFTAAPDVQEEMQKTARQTEV